MNKDVGVAVGANIKVYESNNKVIKIKIHNAYFIHMDGWMVALSTSPLWQFWKRFRDPLLLASSTNNNPLKYTS